MRQRCPQCHRRMSEVAHKCHFCGWTLDLDLPPDETNGGAIEDHIIRPAAAAEARSATTEAHVAAALAAIRREAFDEALDALNMAIVDAPVESLGQCYSLRGFVHYKLGRHEQAIADCSQSIEQRGEDEETLLWRAAARAETNQWRLAIEDLMEARRLGAESVTIDEMLASYVPRAKEWFSQEVQQGRSSADLFYDRGRVNELVGNAAKAIRDFQMALEEDDEHAAAHLGLARQDLAQGRLESAVERATRAMRLAREFRLESLRMRVRANAALQRSAELSDDIKLLREWSAESADEMAQCAMLRAELGDWAGAIDDWTIVRELNPTQLQSLFQRAQLWVSGHNYPRALADYTDYLAAVPDDDRALVARGDVHARLKDWPQAIADYDAALAVNPVNVSAYQGRCAALIELKRYADAAVDCDKALRLANRNSSLYLAQGRILYEQGQYLEADEPLTRAIDVADNEADRGKAYYYRGAARLERNHLADAAADFLEAARARPRHAGTWVWLAQTAARLDDWPQAIEYLQQAMRLRPTVAGQYRALGKPVAHEAIEYFTRQMTRTGKAADGLARRGEAYQFLGKARKALADYTEALRLDPRHITARLRRAQLNTARGRHREALRDATRLAKRDRHSAWAWYWRAVALSELGQLDRAEKSLRRAIRASAAGEPRFFVLQGDLAARQGQQSAAIVAYARAIELDPSDPVALRRRAAVLLRIDQPLGAISDLTRSLEFDPHDAETLIQRGNAFLRTGDGRAADADFQTALGLDATRVKAFCGHGLCLALQGQHEAGLIWLTKSIARFSENRDLAELLMARGKIFFQMGRFPPAITDFTAVMDLRRDDAKAVAVARCARAVAFVQQGELVQAQREFDKVLAAIPDHAGARWARQWLADGQGPRPALLRPPDQVIRPTRPPISGAPLTTEQSAATNGRWDAPPPYDLWVVRNAAQREYGPVTKAVLDQWVREGRVDLHSRVLRAGWPKWRRAPAVYAELAER